MKICLRSTEYLIKCYLVLFIMLILIFPHITKAGSDSFSYNIYVLGNDRSSCASILSAAGHNVIKELDVASLTHANLSEYDQVWFVDTETVPDDPARANLLNFIKSGGKIFFMGDHLEPYRVSLAIWRDNFFNELGAGGIKQSPEIFLSQSVNYTNPFHSTSYSPNIVHQIGHGPCKNGIFDNIGNATVIAGAGLDATGDTIAVAFDYGMLEHAKNTRAVIYLNGNNSTNWDLYAENLAFFLGSRDKVLLSARKSCALPDNIGHLKIDVHNNRTISGIQFKLKDDPDVLTVLETNSTSRSYQFKISSEEDGDGFLRVIISSEQGENILQGTGSIGEITYQVSPNATIGDSADILLSDVIVLDEFGLEMTSSAENGKFYCAVLKGDVVMDGNINIFDLVRVIDIILGRPPEPSEIEQDAADYNSDGIVNILDVVSIINEILGRGPVGLLAKANLTDPVATNIVTNSIVPLSLSCEQEIIGLQMSLNYNAKNVDIGEPQLTLRTSKMNLVSHKQDGEINLIMFCMEGNGNFIPSGNEAILNLPISTNAKSNNGNLCDIKELILIGKDYKPINITDVEKYKSIQNIQPDTYSLLQNYPNPFNSLTEISYILPEESEIQVCIFNLLGEKIITLVNNKQQAGIHHVEWNGKNSYGDSVPSGIYLYRLVSKNFSQSCKLSILK